jgi:basic membrane lipoprotein Med (substrate-binding protein (PBP1-ABC) superfamily)
MSPDSIKSAVKSMRDAQPSWVWDAVNELQTKISNGTVTVPLVMTQDAVDQWRGILG